MKTMIISMPWARRDILSIQLGGLKAFLTERGFEVDSRYYYKDIVAYIGKDLYSDIVVNCLGDLVFSPFYSPHMKDSVSTYLGHILGSEFDFNELYKNINCFINDILYNDVNWMEYDNIAFSTSLVQFVPSLYMARRLKEIKPSINIIFGGASLVDELATSVLSTFDEVDFVIKGEGELTFEELLKSINYESNNFYDIMGLVFRNENNEIIDNPNRDLICDINTLPVPVFDDYFEFSLPKSDFFPPIITIEASRGCFWGKCSFCNLNSQWHNTYREKSVKKVANEIDYQSKKYKLLDFFFTDSNVSNKENLFIELKKQNKDYILHAEVSGHLTRRDFVEMRSAGVKDIQIGIEAFSSSLLKKYTKGVSVMRNIEMLKWCSEFGITVFYNVITGFPTTVQEEVNDTLFNMKYAQYYQYPAITGYSLSYQSEVYQNFKKYNIKSWTIPDEVKMLYDKKFLGNTAPLLSAIVGYEIIQDETTQINWKPVLEFADYWKRSFEKNKGMCGLTYYDGNDFLIIKKKLFDREEQFTLEGIARDIYLYCTDECKSLTKILESFPAITEYDLNELINELFDLELVYYENNLCLSLAVKCGDQW